MVSYLLMKESMKWTSNSEPTVAIIPEKRPTKNPLIEDLIFSDFVYECKTPLFSRKIAEGISELSALIVRISPEASNKRMAYTFLGFEQNLESSGPQKVSFISDRQ